MKNNDTDIFTKQIALIVDTIALLEPSMRAPRAIIEYCGFVPNNPYYIDAIHEMYRIPYEELLKWDKKIKEVKNYTNDPALLSRVPLIALNQEELDTLIEEGNKHIYLCHNTFTIPLNVMGMHYIGIDNPTLNPLYTEQDYREFYIYIENIPLPQRPPQPPRNRKIYTPDIDYAVPENPFYCK